MVFRGATESFCRRGGGRGGRLFVTCPRSRGPRPSMRRRRGIAAGRSFVGKLGPEPPPHASPVAARAWQNLHGFDARWRDSGEEEPPASSCPGPFGGRDAKETRATVQ